MRLEANMKKHKVTTPELAFIAGTRAAGGIGVGLLLSERLSASARRALGWSLVAVGAATTIAAAKIVLDR
jgi:hypothetical protein